MNRTRLGDTAVPCIEPCERVVNMVASYEVLLKRAEAAEAQLQAANTREQGMREALGPLAALADKISPRAKDDDCWCGQDGAVIRYRDIRRATEALRPRDQEEPRPAKLAEDGT